jgi:hypothetical protein
MSQKETYSHLNMEEAARQMIADEFKLNQFKYPDAVKIYMSDLFLCYPKITGIELFSYINVLISVRGTNVRDI